MCGSMLRHIKPGRHLPFAHPRLDHYRKFLERPAEPAGTGLRAHFLGTSSVLLTDENTSILCDGFVSRPGMLSLQFGKINHNRQLVCDAIDRLGVRSSLAAVFCAHSHYDHAMDAPIWVNETGADLIGSESTANIGRGLNVAESALKVVTNGQTLSYNDFELTFIHSVHSPGDLYPGVVTEPLVPPAPTRAWKSATCYSVLINHPQGRILIHASANFIPGALAGYRADVIYFGVGLLGQQSDEFVNTYWNEVVVATGARRIILVHWDDFFRTLDQPFRPLPYLVDDFDATMNRLIPLAERAGVEVLLPTPWQPTNPLAQPNPPRRTRECSAPDEHP
jgi:L-ascorbate metabolism protein UlaG (beta-lactamase superfamily)